MTIAMRRNDYLPTYTTDEGAFYRAANPEVQGPGEPKDQDPQQARTLGMWIPVESVGGFGPLRRSPCRAPSSPVSLNGRPQASVY